MKKRDFDEIQFLAPKMRLLYMVYINVKCLQKNAVSSPTTCFRAN